MHMGIHVPGPLHNSSFGFKVHIIGMQTKKECKVVNTDVKYDWQTLLLRGILTILNSACLGPLLDLLVNASSVDKIFASLELSEDAII